MGGYGSGRPGRYPTAEATASYVLDMARLPLLRTAGNSRSYLTYSDGMTVDITADVSIRPGELVLRHVTHDDREEHIAYTVPLDRTAQPFGGERWWFRCPWTGRRVQKLFLPRGGREFRSRASYRLGYASQRGTALDRLHMRLQRIQRKMGGEGRGPVEGLPAKPRGMWWRTYERLADQWDDTDERLDAAFMAGAVRIIERALRRPRS